MAPRLTIADVARTAGVSASAVSFAFNGRPGVSEATRQRILSTADELGWAPSSGARALARDHADAVGLVITRAPRLLSADPFFPAFTSGVESELEHRGYALLLQVVSDPAAEAARYRQLARRGRVDGVFLTDLRITDDRITLLLELSLPAVTLGRPAQPSPFPAVVPTTRSGSPRPSTTWSTSATPGSRWSTVPGTTSTSATAATPGRGRSPPAVSPEVRR